jgi:heat shock protein HslJ
MRRLGTVILMSTVTTVGAAALAACAPSRTRAAQSPSQPTAPATASPAQAQRSLAGPEWVVTQIQGTPVPAPDAANGPAGRQPSMKFQILEGAPRVTGVGGCNNFSGTYTLSGDRDLEFGPVMATKMACPNLGVEDALFTALQSVRHWNVVSTRLELTDADGKVVVRLEAKQ